MNKNTLGLNFNHKVTLSHLVTAKKKIACMNALMDILSKQTSSWNHMVRNQVPFIQGLVLPTFIYGTKISLT